MHELSLMEAVRQQVLVEAERHGAQRIEAITLRVGSLAGVDPEALALAFEVVMAESIAAGARLLIESVPALARCPACLGTYPVLNGICLCPHCGGLGGHLLQGRELQLATLELE
jgi:hydrogenase nickel incorporation protein HypA/HybF